ncbi:MAG: RluA family pseudouridine synthase [Bdellovibrionia bacterium]
MTRKIQFRISQEHSDIRVDKALANCPDVGTRSRASKLIGLDLVRLKEKPVKPSYITRVGDEFEIEIPQYASTLQPLDLPLEILYEDADIIVLNKPAGLVVHPAEGHPQDTLVNALLHHTKDLSMGFGEKRPGIVHRLDRDTSGLLVVAKNDFAHEGLSKQFRERTSHRLYWALVVGKVTPPKGRIENRLSRHPRDRKKFASIDVGGKIAITNYETVKTYPSGISLLHVKLETGRTHQIRVHLAEKNAPVLADRLYGANQDRRLKSKSLAKTVKDLKRIALHAAELGFNHPKTGQLLAFRSQWPPDMDELLREIERV